MKKVLLVVGVVLLLLAIPVTIYFLGQQRDVRTHAAPATTLSLVPANQTVTVGDSSIKLTVQMDPGANQVVSADIYLTYDATKLQATAITTGTNAPRVLNSGTIENGTASIRVGAASNSQPITTPGPIAVVTFTATGVTDPQTPASVQFASNTFVGAISEPTANVLVGSVGAKITVNDTQVQTGNPTPTATPTSGTVVTPTATPTVTSGLTPTLTSTPTLTPTPTATGSGESAISDVHILVPGANASVTSAEPVIQGTAPPGSTVTIVIYSVAQTVVVTADANGNWTYTPTTALENGPHSVTASILSDSGSTVATTSAFIVASGGESGSVSTQTATPVSGNTENTVIIIGIGLLLMVTGAIIPLVLK